MTPVFRYAIAGAGLAAALSAATAASAASVKPVSLMTAITAIDRNFTCPEFLPDDAARQADLAAFGHALSAVGPRRLTLVDATSIRVRLLERHHCYDTLAAMGQATAMAVQPAAQTAAAPPN